MERSQYPCPWQKKVRHIYHDSIKDTLFNQDIYEMLSDFRKNIMHSLMSKQPIQLQTAFILPNVHGNILPAPMKIIQQR
eukprot:9724323-Ditylum_brightwellii.AAC.1